MAAQRRFAPTLFGTALTVLGVALFVRLGLWQLDRAAEKEAIHEQYAAGQREVVSLDSGNVAELPRYQRVHARGRYDGTQHILLDNMPSAMGQPGYRVVTPFALDSGGWILVDRGWRPMGPSREQIPDSAVGENPREIAGQLDALPRPGLRVAEDAESTASGSWPRVLSFPEHATLERVLGRELLPGLILLDAGQPDGYERLWQARVNLEPERHLGYAVQWFAFAVVAIAIFIILGLRRGRGTNESSQ